MKLRGILRAVVAVGLGLCTAACTAAPATPSAATPSATVASATRPAAAPSAAVSAGPSPSPAASPAAAASPSAVAAARLVAVRPMGTPPGGPISVKAAYPQVTAAVTPVYVAADQGLFQQNGLQVELSQVTGPNQVAALGTGELQFGILGANEVSNADAGGADLVMIATISDFPIFSLYAQPRYASIQDLAGQAIGVTGPGSSTDAAAHLFLRHFNLEDKVTITPAGGSVPGILAAITQGAIAGGILSPPTTAQAAAQGLRELVNGTTLGVPMNHDVIAVSRTYLESNGDAVRRFLTAYQQAWSFCADDRNQAGVVAALAKYTNSSEADARAGYDAVKSVYVTKSVPDVGLDGVRTILELAASPAARNADPSRWIDNSIIDGIAAGG